jgi:hypothetical protein
MDIWLVPLLLPYHQLLLLPGPLTPPVYLGMPPLPSTPSESARPLSDMMYAIELHYELVYTTTPAAFNAPMRLGSFLQPRKLQLFFACHDAGHRACVKKKAMINCWEMVSWAVALVALGGVAQSDRKRVFQKRWPDSALYVGMKRAFSVTSTSSEEVRLAALQVFLRNFLNDPPNLNLLDVPAHLIGAPAEGPAPFRIRYTFPLDCGLALEGYRVLHDGRPMAAHFGDNPPAELQHVSHLVVVVQPDSDNLFYSIVLSFGVDGLRKRPLYHFLRFSGSKVLGRIVELHMHPDPIN